MLSGPLVPVIVSVSFATTAVANSPDPLLDPACARAVEGAAPAVPATPRLTAKTAADARLRWRAPTRLLMFIALLLLVCSSGRGCRSMSVHYDARRAFGSRQIANGNREPNVALRSYW